MDPEYYHYMKLVKESGVKCELRIKAVDMILNYKKEQLSTGTNPEYIENIIKDIIADNLNNTGCAGYSNYPTAYVGLCLNNDPNHFRFINECIESGNTISELTEIYLNLIKHPYSADKKLIPVLRMLKDDLIEPARPLWAVDWHEVFISFYLDFFNEVD